MLLLEDFKLVGAFPSVPADVPREILNLRRQRDIEARFTTYPTTIRWRSMKRCFCRRRMPSLLIAGLRRAHNHGGSRRLTLLAKFQPSLLQDAGADIVIINKSTRAGERQLDLLQWRARQGLGEPLL